MARLIDADELLDWSEIIPLTDDGGIDINDFEEKLKTMPTIDAVPVIRCKDCIYHDITTFRELVLHRCYVNPDDVETSPDGYCYLAERKDK